MFRVDTKSPEEKKSLHWICFRLYETLFFFNLTKQLFHSQLFLLLCLNFLGSVCFSRNVHLIKRYAPAFLVVFGLRQVAFDLEIPFSAL